MLYRFDGREPIIGEGTYVSETSVVIGDVQVGEKCYIGHGVILRGDYGTIEIGDGSAVEECAVLHSPPGETCYIGKMVTIGHGAIIHCKSIGDFAVVGMGSVLSLWSEIGERSIIGEGAVVTIKSRIPAGMVATGNPARVIRQASLRDDKRWNLGKQYYIELAGKYLRIGMDKVG
jgi:carbonic anhydrase/acetyltransferase-like protein (isoleucine patch superfamily)